MGATYPQLLNNSIGLRKKALAKPIKLSSVEEKDIHIPVNRLLISVEFIFSTEPVYP
jgi:hypothetical protein